MSQGLYHLNNNNLIRYASPQMIDIFGALFTLSLSILILNSQRQEGVKYVNVYLRTPITS